MANGKIVVRVKSGPDYVPFYSKDRRRVPIDPTRHYFDSSFEIKTTRTSSRVEGKTYGGAVKPGSKSLTCCPPNRPAIRLGQNGVFVMSDPNVLPYQWDLRPQIPLRPEWFRAWPNGATMAVQILILNEWESVPRHRKRPMAVDLQNRHDYQNKFDFLALGVREYGARHGIWRLLDVLDKHGVKATIPTNGLTAELSPATVRASRDRGHEVAAHQWDMSVFPPMFTSRADEQSALAGTVAAIEDVIGSKVRGYLSPGPRPTPFTLDLLMESGFLWTSDYVDSDFPYVISRNDRRIVAISYATPGYTDGDLSSRGIIQGLAEIKYAFDATLEESKRHPMKFCYAIHPHVSGTVGMARLLDDFLAHVRSRGEIWFPTCSDIAEFWLAGMVR